MRPFVKTASDIDLGETNSYLSVVRRAVFCRQFDALEAISHLVATEKGDVTSPLLRPSCEELIWISYLAIIPERRAEELIRCKTRSEVRKLLSAQRADGGQAVLKKLCLLHYYERSKKEKEENRKRICALGEALDWPADAIEKGEFPSVLWFAKKAGRKNIYDCIYAATSSSVHFSAQGLLRMAWGEPAGRISVRSEQFREYTGAFSLDSAFRLFFETAVELSKAPDLPDDWLTETGLFSVVKQTVALGKVPLITAEELAVPE